MTATGTSGALGEEEKPSKEGGQDPNPTQSPAAQPAEGPSSSLPKTSQAPATTAAHGHPVEGLPSEHKILGSTPGNAGLGSGADHFSPSHPTTEKVARLVKNTLVACGLEDPEGSESEGVGGGVSTEPPRKLGEPLEGSGEGYKGGPQEESWEGAGEGAKEGVGEGSEMGGGVLGKRKLEAKGEVAEGDGEAGPEVGSGDAKRGRGVLGAPDEEGSERGAERLKHSVVEFVRAILDPLYRAEIISKDEYKAVAQKSVEKVGSVFL